MVSRAVLERQLRQRVGDQGRLVRWDRASSTKPTRGSTEQMGEAASANPDGDEDRFTAQLIDIAVQATNDLRTSTGERQIGPADIALYWLESGPPITFSWPGFRPAPIVISRRDLEVSAAIERMLGPELDVAIIRQHARRFFLQYLATVFMREGDPVTAVRLLTSSFAIHASYELPIADGQDARRTIEQAVARHYSLAHELGHVGADRIAHIVPMEAVLLRHRHVLEDHDATSLTRTFARFRHRRTLNALGDRTSIQAAHLRDEMIADKVGALAMFHTTARLELAAGREPDVMRIALVIFRMHKVRHLMQVVEDRVARMCRPWQDVVDPLMEQASHARLHEVGTALAETLAGATENDFGWNVGDLHGELLQLDAELHPRYELVADALNNALAHVADTATASANLAEQVSALLGADDGRYRELATTVIERLAQPGDARGHRHVDLECLPRLVRGESMGTSRTRYFLSFRRGKRLRLPIVLSGKDNPVVAFLFESDNSSRYQRWTQIVSRAFGTKVELDHETLTDNWDWKIAARVDAAIPAPFRRGVRICIEGTEVFDRLWRHVETNLHDGEGRGAPSSYVRLKEVPLAG